MPAKKVKAGTSKDAAALRRRVFVDAYIANGGNATEAAKSAGYSKKTARQQGARLLSDVAIKASIAARAEKTAKKYELTADLVVRSLVRDLSFDPAKLYNEDGTLKQITELDEDTRTSLAAVEFLQVGSLDAPVFVRKVKWQPPSPAREQAAKILGMFREDNKQKTDALAELLSELKGTVLGVAKDG